MNNTGPILETLTHRLADTPAAFLDGHVHIAALVNDLLYLHGARAGASQLAGFLDRDGQHRERLRLTSVMLWLLADDWFVARRFPQPVLLQLFTEEAGALTHGVGAQAFVNDPDRREELARIVLARLDLRPEGETIAQASDRLSSISGTERRRLVEASRAATQRAREVRAALARKAAEEAADKWTRE